MEDPSDAHRDYSAALTHRPRNRMDVDRGTGGGEGGRTPSKRTPTIKTALCSGPILHW